MNDKLKNTIFKFLDLYAGHGFRYVTGHHSSYIITNNGTSIFDHNWGHVIVNFNIRHVICSFFNIGKDLSRSIIIEWFLNVNKLTHDNIIDIFNQIT